MVVPQFLDIEQSVLLLELEPPFDKRAVQLARRRMAKRWHPDIAPPGRQHEHERHLKAINEAADQLERLAEDSRGGKVSRNAVKVSAAAARKARAEEGQRAYEAEQRAREQAADREKHDPFASRVPDHSVVHRYARCLSYPEWGVGSVNGIYFTGDGDDIQQWARVSFQVGVRTVPAGSLQFVDFSKPDPGADRVERFMTAAKHALAEGDFALAAQRLVYARDAEPENPAVLRLLATAFWQAGNLAAAGRAVRDWARVEPDRPAPHCTAARIYEDQGALSMAIDSAVRETERAPADGGAFERLGRLRLRTFDREGARAAYEQARAIEPSEQGLLDLALVCNLMGDTGAEVSACEQATKLAPESAAAWSRLAHALARTDRASECIAACDRALALLDDPEVRNLRAQVLATQPRAIEAAA
jgi:tetratricopeptide (TPR) repeat protein